MIARIADLPDNRSFFLFGPRQTGKSSIIRTRFGDDAWTVNLLHGDEYSRYAKHPAQYRLDAEEKIRTGIRGGSSWTRCRGYRNS